MSTVQVTVSQGDLKGKIVTTDNGFIYNSFQGIPYAKPPLGDLRFQDPQPAESWHDVYDATFERDISPQIDMIFSKKYQGNEDCLYLNVYSPTERTYQESLPVMFWIHGGAFSMGSGNSMIYGADYLVEKNVIIVTFNYRLGPLGFLCLNTKDNSGNAGMKDQSMALKWVKDNIDQFGGDPNNITIFGESAGGVSIHGHMLSPMSAGLFHKAILQSGTCLIDWSIKKNPESTAYKLARFLGIQSTDKSEVLEKLRKISAEELITASSQSLVAVATGLDIAFGPVIEKENVANQPFLCKCPLEMMTAGEYSKVPTMIGFTSKEGVLLYYKFVSTSDIKNPSLDQLVPDFKQIISPEYLACLGPEKSQEVADRIKRFYFPTNCNMFEDYIDMVTDSVFLKDINTTVKLLAQHSQPTYYYKFLYSGTMNIFKFICPFKYTGAAHGDELGYLFATILPKSQMTEDDIKVTRNMTEMWTNFAKVGNPTPKLSENISVIWDPVTEQKLNCLEINNTDVLVQNPFAERVKFWNDIKNMCDNVKGKCNVSSHIPNKI